jgi:hypothetical protein
VSFTAINLCVTFQRVFIVVSVYFVNDFTPKMFGYNEEGTRDIKTTNKSSKLWQYLKNCEWR